MGDQTRMQFSEANKLRILYFLAFACTASWLPIFADFLKGVGMTGMRIGVLLGITPLMMFAVQPVYGVMADRIGYKKCLTWSTFFAAIAFAGYFIDGGFAWVFLLTVVMSLFYNATQPLLDSLSLRLTERDPSFSYGSLRIAGAAGWAFTGIVVGQFIRLGDSRAIFAASSTAMALAFAFSFTLPRDERKPGTSPRLTWREIRVVFGNGQLLVLLAAVFLVSAGSSTIYYFYSIYMKENGASSSLIGLAISFQGICELPLFYFSARIIRGIGIKATLLVTVFTTSLRMLLYSLIDAPAWAVLIELLHGVSWSLFWVVCVEYVNKLVPAGHRAAGQSVLTAAFYGAGAIVGNLWTGFLYGTQLKVSEIFLLNAGIVLVVGVVMVVRRPKTEDRRLSPKDGKSGSQ